MDTAVQEDTCQDGKVNSIYDAEAKGRKPSIKEVAYSIKILKKKNKHSLN
jgi:hypothetical protein